MAVMYLPFLIYKAISQAADLTAGEKARSISNLKTLLCTDYCVPAHATHI